MNANHSTVFLSASIPDRLLQTYTCKADQIRDAIRALVEETVRDRVLVFGGHPAISPLVWGAANDLNSTDRVVIYQSRKYEKLIPVEASYFKNLVWTDAVPKDEPDGDDPYDTEKSLTVMRAQMIEKRSGVPGPRAQELPPFEAGLFIGGMEGVEDEEWRFFRRTYPNVPAFPVASTGGAAHRLWDRLFVKSQDNRYANPALDVPDPLTSSAREVLSKSEDYRSIFRWLLRDKAVPTNLDLDLDLDME
jgi:hypothetical protein